MGGTKVIEYKFLSLKCLIKAIEYIAEACDSLGSTTPDVGPLQKLALSLILYSSGSPMWEYIRDVPMFALDVGQ